MPYAGAKDAQGENGVVSPGNGRKSLLLEGAGLRDAPHDAQHCAHAALEAPCIPSSYHEWKGALEGEHQRQLGHGCGLIEPGSAREEPPGSSAAPNASEPVFTSNYEPEWEDDADRDSPSVGFRTFFGGLYTDAMEYEELDFIGMRVRLRMYSGELKHTLAHTGLMRWTVAPLLARLLAASPHLLEGKPFLFRFLLDFCLFFTTWPRGFAGLMPQIHSPGYSALTVLTRSVRLEQNHWPMRAFINVRAHPPKPHLGCMRPYNASWQHRRCRYMSSTWGCVKCFWIRYVLHASLEGVEETTFW